MSGQWNRKSGGHVFLNDPRSLVEGLLDNGTLSVIRDGFFETPPEVVEQMLQLVWPKIGERILEPSAGLGAIANLLPVIIKSDIVCIERNQERCDILRSKGYHVICADFLATNLTERFYTIYMNPPFEEMQDVDHVMKAHSYLQHGGQMVSVMSPAPFFRQDKRAEAFRSWFQQNKGTRHMLADDAFKASGTGVQGTSLVVLKRV